MPISIQISLQFVSFLPSSSPRSPSLRGEPLLCRVSESKMQNRKSKTPTRRGGAALQRKSIEAEIVMDDSQRSILIEGAPAHQPCPQTRGGIYLHTMMSKNRIRLRSSHAIRFGSDQNTATHRSRNPKFTIICKQNPRFRSATLVGVQYRRCHRDLIAGRARN